MKKKGAQPPEVIWLAERKTLTLEGEPVLEYALSWPELRDSGPGGRWITRYYARLAKLWRLRWQRELYWQACLDLAERRASSRPFTPWHGKLSGEVTRQEGDLLSLRLVGEEVRGDGKVCLVRWGDVWKVREGAPCPLRELFPGHWGWKKALISQIADQGRTRRAAGDCFLDPDWEDRLKKFFPIRDFCLTEEGVEFAFPQCSIAPAVEGTPVFLLPRPEKAPETASAARA